MIVTPSFTTASPLGEYPRPQFRRNSFFSLNGVWEYAITTSPQPPSSYQGNILVPYSPESNRSGVERALPPDGYLHYRKHFTLPVGFRKDVVLLNVGACDQVCTVYCNGQKVGSHEGGYLPFTMELPVTDGENELCFVVQDNADSDVYGRGKQSYRRGGIWYTATSGIWQSVFLESVPNRRLERVKLLPDYENKQLTVDWTGTGESLRVEVYDGETFLLQAESKERRLVLDVSVCKPWSPDSPELYRLRFLCGEDEVESYFGLRSFTVVERNGLRYFAVNGVPTFQNGLLDQGYWQDGIYTPNSNREQYEEIKRVKALGFNFLRKHIKVESALWYYYCDCLGMLVWQDMLNGGGAYSWLRIHLCPFVDLHIDDKNYAGMKRSNPASRAWYRKEAYELIDTLYNCVSLCLWTPFNEAWGQFDALEVWKELHAYDPSRWYDHASGWQDKGGGDVYSRHIYFRKVKLKNDRKRVLALTEFGGYSYALPGHTTERKQFGYKGFRSQAEFQTAFAKLYRTEIIPAIREQGLCATVYTQLTDVEEEINGLYTIDRICKADEGEVRAINREVALAFREKTQEGERE